MLLLYFLFDVTNVRCIYHITKQIVILIVIVNII
nr:MAG TPA: hypothetical protein [Caudoviricetes sp.]